MPEYTGSVEKATSKTIEMTEGLAAWTLPPNLSVLLEHHLQHCGPEYLTDNSVKQEIWMTAYPVLEKLDNQFPFISSVQFWEHTVNIEARSVPCPVASKLNKEISQCSSCCLKENEGASRSRPISLSQKPFVEKNHPSMSFPVDFSCLWRQSSYCIFE